MSRRAQRIINLVLLQVAVVAPLLLAASRPVAAATIGWIACALQLAVSADRRRDLSAMLIAGVLGSTVEWAATWLGAMRFEGVLLGGIAPGWLFPSWAMLGASMYYVLSVLHRRPVIATALGGLATVVSLYGATMAGQIAVASLVHLLVIALALGVAVGVTAMVVPPLSADNDPR